MKKYIPLIVLLAGALACSKPVTTLTPSPIIDATPLVENVTATSPNNNSATPTNNLLYDGTGGEILHDAQFIDYRQSNIIYWEEWGDAIMYDRFNNSEAWLYALGEPFNAGLLQEVHLPTRPDNLVCLAAIDVAALGSVKFTLSVTVNDTPITAVTQQHSVASHKHIETTFELTRDVTILDFVIGVQTFGQQDLEGGYFDNASLRCNGLLY